MGKICVFLIHKPFFMALHCGLLISSRSTSRRLIYCSYRACVKQYLTTEWQRKDEWALALVGHVWRALLLLQKLDDLSWSPCGIPKWATTELRAMIYMGAQETPRRWRRRRNVLIKQANSISKSSRTNWETLDAVLLRKWVGIWLFCNELHVAQLRSHIVVVGGGMD